MVYAIQINGVLIAWLKGDCESICPTNTAMKSYVRENVAFENYIKIRLGFK